MQKETSKLKVQVFLDLQEVTSQMKTSEAESTFSMLDYQMSWVSTSDSEQTQCSFISLRLGKII